MKNRLSRRIFLKTSMSCAAGWAAGLREASGSATKQIAVSRTSLKALRAIPTTCQQCPAGCGIIAYLDGDRLVQILGNPDHPLNQGGICARGLTGINLANDPERLLYPLKRTGARGGGRWTRISWDEAFHLLSGRIQKLENQGRLSEMVLDIGQHDLILDRFIQALAAVSLIDRPLIKNLNVRKALMSLIGTPLLIEDVGKSQTIFNFGANPLANHDRFLGLARRLTQAQLERGTRLVTFDVRMSETAAKSDEWHPLRAGTDGIVALAMAQVILAEGLGDEAFRANGPIIPLKEHLRPYTPEAAEAESGVSRKDIIRLAVEFATRRPSLAILGGGVSDHANGTLGARCVALLNILVGSIGKEGGWLYPRLPLPALRYRSLGREESLSLKNTADLEQSRRAVDTYFAYLSNPAFEEPDCLRTSKLLKDSAKLPFLVVMDTHLTETAQLADLVLPAATYLEGWSLQAAPSLDDVAVLNLRQPVLSLQSPAQTLRSPHFDVGKLIESTFRPRGEAKDISTFCLEMARWVGGMLSKNLSFEGVEDFILDLLSSSEIPELHFSVLKKKGFWTDSDSPYRASAPGRKADVLGGQTQGDLSDLPFYKPTSVPTGLSEENFVLTMFKTGLSASNTANSKWAREILHENRLWINKDIAVRLGIKNGDRVQVTSPKGSLVARALTTARIHPQSVAIAEGLGHTGVGSLARAQRSKTRDIDTQLLWWSKRGNGTNPFTIIGGGADPEGGGPVLKDTVVSLKKI